MSYQLTSFVQDMTGLMRDRATAHLTALNDLLGEMRTAAGTPEGYQADNLANAYARAVLTYVDDWEAIAGFWQGAASSGALQQVPTAGLVVQKITIDLVGTSFVFAALGSPQTVRVPFRGPDKAVLQATNLAHLSPGVNDEIDARNLALSLAAPELTVKLIQPNDYSAPLRLEARTPGVYMGGVTATPVGGQPMMIATVVVTVLP